MCFLVTVLKLVKIVHADRVAPNKIKIEDSLGLISQKHTQEKTLMTDSIYISAGYAITRSYEYNRLTDDGIIC
jgi:hypothetical protein